jgi:hypothetical protein
MEGSVTENLNKSAVRLWTDHRRGAQARKHSSEGAPV